LQVDSSEQVTYANCLNRCGQGRRCATDLRGHQSPNRIRVTNYRCPPDLKDACLPRSTLSIFGNRGVMYRKTPLSRQGTEDLRSSMTDFRSISMAYRPSSAEPEDTQSATRKQIQSSSFQSWGQQPESTNVCDNGAVIGLTISSTLVTAPVRRFVRRYRRHGIHHRRWGGPCAGEWGRHGIRTRCARSSSAGRSSAVTTADSLSRAWVITAISRFISDSSQSSSKSGFSRSVCHSRTSPHTSDITSAGW